MATKKKKPSFEARRRAMVHYVQDNFVDVVDVVHWLDLSIEDIIEMCPDLLVGKYEEAFGETENVEEDFGSRAFWEED